MSESYLLNDKFVKLYLNTAENNTTNTLIKKTLEKIIKYYDVLEVSEKKWLEEYLSCLIEVKKIIDIPKQLNLFLYYDKLPQIKAKFLRLREQAQPKYQKQLERLEQIINKELNYYFKNNINVDVEKTHTVSKGGFHLTRFN